MYLYTAMADIAIETGDHTLVEACDRLWKDVTGRKMYITGGIGSSEVHEAFSTAFDLPNDTAYAETCAAIGLLLFSSRMVRLHDEARYADVMERCLYNGIISGLSLDGEGYFYVNPLEVEPRICDANPTMHSVKYRRQPWYGCACCPPNIARTLSSLGDHLYHQNGDTLFADLYHEGTVSFMCGGANVSVRQKTKYPWSGSITFAIEPESPATFTLAVRVPAWCRQPSLAVNGVQAAAKPDPDGYLRVRKAWKKGERVDLHLPMEIRRTHADPRVRAAFGKVALQRGPLVYCLEGVDNGPDLFSIVLPAGAALEPIDHPELLGGVVAIKGEGRGLPDAKIEGGLYRDGTGDILMTERPLLFIPYYAWANRREGEMIVWVRE
jgi:DUF1680 family protein